MTISHDDLIKLIEGLTESQKEYIVHLIKLLFCQASD